MEIHDFSVVEHKPKDGRASSKARLTLKYASSWHPVHTATTLVSLNQQIKSPLQEAPSPFLPPSLPTLCSLARLNPNISLVTSQHQGSSALPEKITLSEPISHTLNSPQNSNRSKEVAVNPAGNCSLHSLPFNLLPPPVLPMWAPCSSWNKKRKPSLQLPWACSQQICWVPAAGPSLLSQ